MSEKVIKGLEALSKAMHMNQCYACSHEFIEVVQEFGTNIIEDAIALLKEKDIETIAIRNIVPNRLANKIEFVKTDMANKIASKLVAEGFVEFFSSEYKYAPVADVTEIEARVCVVKPMQKGCEMKEEKS